MKKITKSHYEEVLEYLLRSLKCVDITDHENILKHVLFSLYKLGEDNVSVSHYKQIEKGITSILSGYNTLLELMDDVN